MKYELEVRGYILTWDVWDLMAPAALLIGWML